MANRLADETSPYLIQHQDNPVDWYPWGEAAFAEAKASNRPLLISVGYSACHWCHVMAHESFEDPETAALMNEHFVNVKVDREERPDVDSVYMRAVQAMSGHGGWPMTVFATPEGEPFFAGTYFPKEDRHGMPSFRRVLAAMADTWENRREELTSRAATVTAAVRRPLPSSPGALTVPVIAAAYGQIIAGYDPGNGGFGGAPKFPQVPSLEFLLRVSGEPWATEAGPALRNSLENMARGGIHDQIGGGFARYATDAGWLVPHFEKMLYDNALLARLYLRAGQATRDGQFLAVAARTLDYMLSDLRLPGGGFASAEDADSDGVEGEFYVWTADEFRRVAGDDADLAARVLGVTDEGNFEGRNILHIAEPIESVAAEVGMQPSAVTAAVARAAERLKTAREGRVRPGLDDKVITAWNGLTIRALAEAGAVLERPEYLDAAIATAGFVESELRSRDGRLMRSYRDGRTEVPGFLEDYAAHAVGLLSLYQVSRDEKWFSLALDTLTQLHTLFWDDDRYYATGADADALIDRPVDVMDNPAPSGNSLAAEAMGWAGLLTGEPVWLDRAAQAIDVAGGLATAHPSAVGHLLAVAYSQLSSPQEIAVVSGDAAGRLRLSGVFWEDYRPGSVIASASDPEASKVPLVQTRPASPVATAYVCQNFTCEAPTSDPERLRELLAR